MSQSRTHDSEFRSLIHDLQSESSSSDARYLSILRCKNIQLERSVGLLHDIVSRRRHAVYDIGNRLLEFEDLLSPFVESFVERKSESKGELSLTDEEISSIFRWSQRMRERLRAVEDEGQAIENRPFFFFPSRAISAHPVKEPNLLELAKGESYEHIEPAFVYEIEEELRKLFQQLMYSKQQIELAFRSVSSSSRPEVADSLSCLSSLRLQIETLIRKMRELSAVVPPKRRPDLRDWTPPFKELVTALPPFSRNRSEGQQLLRNLCALIRSREECARIEIQALEEEIEFLRQIQDSYEEYIRSLPHDTSRVAAPSMNSESPWLNPSDAQNLRNVVSTFQSFDTYSSEDTLKEFLLTFKENCALLSVTIERASGMHPTRASAPTSAMSRAELSARIDILQSQFNEKYQLLVSKRRERMSAADEERSALMQAAAASTETAPPTPPSSSRIPPSSSSTSHVVSSHVPSAPRSTSVSSLISKESKFVSSDISSHSYARVRRNDIVFGEVDPNLSLREALVELNSQLQELANHEKRILSAQVSENKKRAALERLRRDRSAVENKKRETQWELNESESS